MSQRIDENGKVTLYAELIKDMNLATGDFVVFVRNDAGCWEVRRADEVAQKMKVAWDAADARETHSKDDRQAKPL